MHHAWEFLQKKAAGMDANAAGEEVMVMCSRTVRTLGLHDCDSVFKILMCPISSYLYLYIFVRLYLLFHVAFRGDMQLFVAYFTHTACFKAPFSLF